MLLRDLVAAEAVAVQGSVMPGHSSGVLGHRDRHRSSSAAAQGAQGAPSSCSLCPSGLLCSRGRFWRLRWMRGCPCTTRRRAGMPLRSGGSGAGRAARAVCRCRLGGGRFPGEGRLRSWLGNVGVCGQGGPSPAPAAGACSCLPLPVGAAPAAAGLAAAFPEKQPRLSTWLASLPLTWLLHETGRSSLWIHLWEILLRLLWGVVWAAWGPCSSDQPAHAGPLLVAGIGVCHHGFCWRQRLKC